MRAKASHAFVRNVFYYVVSVARNSIYKYLLAFIRVENYFLYHIANEQIEHSKHTATNRIHQLNFQAKTSCWCIQWVDNKCDAKKTFRFQYHEQSAKEYKYAMRNCHELVKLCARFHLQSIAIHYSTVSCNAFTKYPHLKNHSREKVKSQDTSKSLKCLSKLEDRYTVGNSFIDGIPKVKRYRNQVQRSF